jgi:hypothetical protein
MSHNVPQEEIDGAVASVMENANPPKPSQEDLAARDYMVLLPIFEKKLDEMSNRQLKKVVLSLMKYPFDSMSIPVWSYPQEQELFNIGMKIADCRFVLMKSVLEMKKEEMDKMMKETTEVNPNNLEELK